MPHHHFRLATAGFISCWYHTTTNNSSIVIEPQKIWQSHNDRWTINNGHVVCLHKYDCMLLHVSWKEMVYAPLTLPLSPSLLRGHHQENCVRPAVINYVPKQPKDAAGRQKPQEQQRWSEAPWYYILHYVYIRMIYSVHVQIQLEALYMFNMYGYV